MKKIFFLFAVMLCSIQNNVAQTSNLDKVATFSFKNVKAIYQNDQVVGYYFMCTLDKSDGIYGLYVYDTEFKQTHYKEVTKSKSIVLEDAKFNGSHFCFQFFNDKEFKYDFSIFDGALNETGSFAVAIPKDMAEAMKDAASSGYGNMFTQTHTLISIPETGFAVHGADFKTQKFEIKAYSNSGSALWTGTSGNGDSKSYEMLTPISNDKNGIAFEAHFSKNVRKMYDGEAFLVFFNGKTGNQTKVPLPKFKNIVTINDISEEKTSYIIGGEYYEESTKQTGICVIEISKEGSPKSEVYISLKQDAAKVMSDPAKLKMLEDKSVLIRKVFLMGGKTIVIGEAYDKKNIYDMLIFEIQNGALTKIYSLDKKKTSIASYINMVNSQAAVGMILKMGIFSQDDYCYTTFNSDKTSFTTLYCNYEKDSESGDYIIGAATYKNGQVTNDQVKLSTKPTQFTVLPAKPGYVAVFEYYKKGKKIVMRMEKLNT